MRSDSYSAPTIKVRINVVTRICLQHNVPDGRITELHVRLFLGSADYSRNTVLNYLRHLQAWAKFVGIDDPTTDIRRPATPEFVPRPVTEPQLSMLLANALPRMAAWIKLGAYCGLRASEAATVTGRQFHDQGDTATLFLRGKGSKNASIPVARHVMTSLEPFMTPGRLWDITPEYLSNQFREFSHTLGMDLGFHQNRHRFGTIVYQQTKNILVTQRLLRHASPKQTTAYVLVSDDAHPVVEALPAPEDEPATEPDGGRVSYRRTRPQRRKDRP